MDLAAFREAVNGYRRPTGHSQQEMSAELGLHPDVLSHKLRGSDGALLQHPEVRGIVRVLAAWQALTTREQALHLLALMDLGPNIFSSDEWHAPPLASLDVVPGQSAPVRFLAEPTTGLMPRGNLPADITPLVGRVDQLRQVLELLEGSTRLVTLTGTGGTGKTRLALAAATAFAERSSAPACLVNLAAVRDPSLVPAAIGAELGLREPARGGHAIDDLLADYLRDRVLLLVLDNLEQVLGVAAFISQVLRAASGLKVLATSRVPVRIYGEHEFRVPPLRLPAPGASNDEVLASEAVTLFVQRARAVHSDFSAGSAEAALLGSICTRLDGLPLAIELAAARSRHLTLPALLDRLSHRLDVLAAGPRDMPARQQTLRATLDWSYRLLTIGRQRLFAQLAVFAGGWTVDAARAVCADDPEGVEAGLWELVDHSLLEVATASLAQDEPRFRMLETVREYALARLAASGTFEACAERHADWYLHLAERVSSTQLDLDQAAALEQEQDNLRAALTWTSRHGEADRGLRLGTALASFWYLQGRYAEGRAWLTELLAKPGAAVPSRTRARALMWAGELMHCQGEDVAAEALLLEGEAVAEQIGDGPGRALCLHVRGNAARARGDLNAAWALYAQSLGIRETLEECVEAVPLLPLLGMAFVSLERGDLGQARSFGHRALAAAEQQWHTWGIARSLYVLGCVAQRQGDYGTATAWLLQSIAIQRQRADKQGLTLSLLTLAEVAHSQDDTALAREILTEQLTLARTVGDRRGVVSGLEAIACLIAKDRAGSAVRLVAAADALRHDIGAPPSAHERQRLEDCLATARVGLESQAYASACADGARLSMEHAVSRGLECLSSAECDSAVDSTPGVSTNAGHVNRRSPRPVRTARHRL
jgi:predicted ATPase